MNMIILWLSYGYPTVFFYGCSMLVFQLSDGYPMVIQELSYGLITQLSYGCGAVIIWLYYVYQHVIIWLFE